LLSGFDADLSVWYLMEFEFAESRLVSIIILRIVAPGSRRGPAAQAC